MRRSTVVQLTLLPMLATAAVATTAAGDPPTETPSPDAQAELHVEVAAPRPAPGAAELMPPGMTPTIMELSCDDDPSWRLRPDCVDDGWYESYHDGGVIRGGFGTYFYGGGGG